MMWNYCSWRRPGPRRPCSRWRLRRTGRRWPRCSAAWFPRHSRAGHLPPVIARPGQPAELADVQTGALIGVVHRALRPVTTVAISPGTLLCFFTDGLVERPGEVIDEGLDRLCRAMTAQPPEVAC